MSEMIHPKDQPDSKDWETPVDRGGDDTPTRGIDGNVAYNPPKPDYGWRDSAELHGDEDGGQEP